VPSIANQREVRLDVVKAKFDMLVTEGIISSAELELAQRSARKKNKDLEEVLMGSFRLVAPTSASRFPHFSPCRWKITKRIGSNRWIC